MIENNRALWFRRCQKKKKKNAESSHKNRINCIKQNVTEFAKFLMELNILKMESRKWEFGKNKTKFENVFKMKAFHRSLQIWSLLNF